MPKKPVSSSQTHSPQHTSSPDTATASTGSQAAKRQKSVHQKTRPAAKTTHNKGGKNHKVLPKFNKYSYFALKNANDRFFNPHRLSVAGKTPFAVIYQNDLVSLRHYSVKSLEPENVPLIIKKHRVPVVIVPPLAVNMLIYDLFPQRSFVRFLLNHGFEVYLIDWGRPSRKQAKYHLGTYVQKLLPEFLQQVRQHSGQQELSLHGWSLGGVFCLTYTALLKDQNIRNIIIQGSPIDLHRSGFIGKILQFTNGPAQWIRHNTGLRLRKLPSHFFHVAGWQNTIGFKLTDPVATVRGYIGLAKNLLNREEVIKHATSSRFLNDMQAYPGGVVRDLMLRLWIDNELASGSMLFKDQLAHFKDIHSNLLAMGGQSDTFVTSAAVRPAIDIVGSQDKTFVEIPGGHMGIVSGKKAPTDVWPLIASWLDGRSD